MAKPFGQKHVFLITRNLAFGGAPRDKPSATRIDGEKHKKGATKMNKIKLGMLFFVVVAFFAVPVVYAQSDKKLQPKEVKQKAVPVQLKDKVEPKQVTPAVSEPKVAPVNIPQRTPFTGSRQGYQMVTDVLDSFGGESESDNYRIPVNSGGQPSTIGISESDDYAVEVGFVHASFVNRGDANGDGIIELGDIVYLINFVYKGGDPPCPMEAGDANCDGIVELGDIVYLINYVYKSGPAPAC